LNSKSYRYGILSDSPNEKIATAGINTLFVRVSQGVSSLVINVLIGRIGGSSLLGSVQSVISSASLTSLIYAVPVSGALSRHLAILKSKNNYDQIAALNHYIVRRILFFTSLITFFFSFVSIYFFDLPIIIVALTAIFIYLYSFKSFADSLHFGLGKTKRLARLSPSLSLFSVISVLILLGFGVRSIWIILPLIVSNLIFILASQTPTNKMPVPKSMRSQIFSFVIFEAIGTLGSSGFQQLSVLVATIAIGLEYTGNLSVALTLTGPLLLATGALSSVLFPALGVSHHHNDTAALTRRVNLATRSTSVFVVSVSIILIITAPFLIELLWGSSFGDAVILTQVITVVTCVYAVAATSVTYVTSESIRGMRFSAFASMGGAILGLVSWVFLLKDFPELAIPVGLSISGISTATVIYTYTWRKLRQRWGLQSFLVLIFMAGSFAISYLPNLGEKSFITIFIYSIIWVFIWIMCRFSDAKELFLQLRAVLQSQNK
jgi:O-antigen/teichoic acid export membrane protein